jgi:hypothetical protein
VEREVHPVGAFEHLVERRSPVPGLERDVRAVGRVVDPNDRLAVGRRCVGAGEPWHLPPDVVGVGRRGRGDARHQVRPGGTHPGAGVGQQQSAERPPLRRATGRVGASVRRLLELEDGPVGRDADVTAPDHVADGGPGPLSVAACPGDGVEPGGQPSSETRSLERSARQRLLEPDSPVVEREDGRRDGDRPLDRFESGPEVVRHASRWPPHRIKTLGAARRTESTMH